MSIFSDPYFSNENIDAERELDAKLIRERKAAYYNQDPYRRVSYYVEVLLNETEDEDGRKAIFTRFRNEPAYQTDDHLVQVWSGSITVYEDAESVLDKAFEMFNREAPAFVGDEAYPHRSLSVGDCVRIDECETWVCEPTGWRNLGLI